MYLANVVWELLEKRGGISRFRLEAAGAGVSLALLGLAGAPLPILSVLALLLLALELANRLWERELLTRVPARLDPNGLRSKVDRDHRFPAPSVHPALTLTLEALFIERCPSYRLGVLGLGVAFEIELIIGNHTPAPTQQPVTVTLSAPDAWRASGAATVTLAPLQPARVARVQWTLQPDRAAPAGGFEITVAWDGERRTLCIAHEGCRRIEPDEIRTVALARYPGARRAAFAWRGDMDLYDTSSFQSLTGLEAALKLGARYGIAQTLYVSTRLTFDQATAREWADHYGVDRGAAEIPRFIDWLGTQVELRHTSPYPAESNRPYVIELGNHGHLHYDTDAAGAAGNGWKAGARSGEGRYSWVGLADSPRPPGEQLC